MADTVCASNFYFRASCSILGSQECVRAISAGLQELDRMNRQASDTVVPVEQAALLHHHYRSPLWLTTNDFERSAQRVMSFIL